MMNSTIESILDAIPVEDIEEYLLRNWYPAHIFKVLQLSEDTEKTLKRFDIDQIKEFMEWMSKP